MDTVIILKNPLVYFTIWNYPNVKELDAKELTPYKEPPVKEPAPIKELAPYRELPTKEPLIKGPATYKEPPAKEPSAKEPSAEEPSAEEPVVEESVVEPNVLEVSSHEEEIQYHVSSSHLRLASPKFKSMLFRGNWKEGIPNENNGCYYIPTKDWDGEAFLILLNALYLRNRQVP